MDPHLLAVCDDHINLHADQLVKFVVRLILLLEYCIKPEVLLNVSHRALPQLVIFVTYVMENLEQHEGVPYQSDGF